jgi:hypothetical protein
MLVCWRVDQHPRHVRLWISWLICHGHCRRSKDDGSWISLNNYHWCPICWRRSSWSASAWKQSASKWLVIGTSCSLRCVRPSYASMRSRLPTKRHDRHWSSRLRFTTSNTRHERISSGATRTKRVC